MTIKVTRFFIISCLLAVFSTKLPADITIVKDGIGQAEIIIPKNPLSSVRFAAYDLQKHLELISGAKLDITDKPSSNKKYLIYVGSSKYTEELGIKTSDLPLEGYKIIVKDNFIALVGNDEQRSAFPFNYRKKEDLEKWHRQLGIKLGLPKITPGERNKELGFYTLDATATLYAVSAFLEQLGVRWYMPYENGTVIPTLKTITLPTQNVKVNPAFEFREFNFSSAMATDAEGVAWFKHLKYGASYFQINYQNIRNVFNADLLEKTNPEYFAHKGGKPFSSKSKRGTPKLGNKKLREDSVKYLRTVFDIYPDIKYLGLHMPMGFERIDEDDALRWPSNSTEKDGKLSEYVWDYWLYLAEELKKTHPDKKLSCFAFATYRMPPEKTKNIPDNISILLSYGTKYLFNPIKYAEISRLQKNWYSIAESKELFIYERFGYYRNGIAYYPEVFTKLLQSQMKKLNGKCSGKLFEVAVAKDKEGKRKIACAGISHLTYYLQGKLYWNPNLDLQKLLEEYYSLFYGPAAKEMKEFYTFAERVWMRPESRKISLYGGFMSPADADQYSDILRRAKKKAGIESVYAKRIEVIENDLKPMAEFLNDLTRKGPDIIATTDKQNWHEMLVLKNGSKPEKNNTEVSIKFSSDYKYLLVSAICHEENMKDITTSVTTNDDYGIFNDDVIEIYIESPELSYAKIVINYNGAVFDECTDFKIVQRNKGSENWDPGITAKITKLNCRWVLEAKIPLADFGTLPSENSPWGINVCRTRFSGDTSETFAISPTYGKPFATPNRFANLYIK